tara:strand:+ start:359 stop:643 length:285 start_codon:yes stop_codon:yes gene_type:complete
VVLAVEVMFVQTVVAVVATVVLELLHPVLTLTVVLEELEEIIIGAQDQTSLMVVEEVVLVRVLVALVVLVDLVVEALDKLRDPHLLEVVVEMEH